ncbi:MAG: CBS domain-containing protein [Methanobacteriota archaeon]
MKNVVLVKEAMKYNPVIVASTLTVLEAARLMKQHKIGNVIVVEKKQPIGILTESDILKKIVAENRKPDEVLVKDVMTTPVIIIDPYVSIETALTTMGKCNIRRLPVIENGELVGIITQKDISRISPVLHEISREWYSITSRDESHLKKQIYSGKCEDCGNLSPNLKSVEGRLLCEECIDELKYDENASDYEEKREE